jgi:nucleotide-binding universal stress UspA family protein
MTGQPRRQDQAAAPDLDRPLVVGVAPDGRSASAVVWAAEEANRTGLPLLLVTAQDDADEDASGDHDLPSLARRLTLTDVQYLVREGRASRVILDAIGDSAALTVVGRRGMSLIRRTAVGGTSLTVVTQSPCPVIMVPEEWTQPSLCAEPIALGLTPDDLFEDQRVGDDDPQRPVIEFAFQRAESMRVPLLVASAWGIPPSLLRNPGEIARCRDRFAQRLALRLAGWRDLYPDVEVSLYSQAANALAALLDIESGAQLTVVGRHGATTPPPSGLGSTARALVRRAHRPVAVIPIEVWGPSWNAEH